MSRLLLALRIFVRAKQIGWIGDSDMGISSPIHRQGEVLKCLVSVAQAVVSNESIDRQFGTGPSVRKRPAAKELGGQIKKRPAREVEALRRRLA